MNLDRHNLVEASAGTGKTYTIEQIVLRLLEERQIELDRILVVTFTEKATGELKTRLRQSLEAALDSKPDPGGLLQRNLDSFDQAPIFTIHGFCQRILREFPLEQGQEFALELVSSGELLRPALREVQRRWPKEFGAALPDLLTQVGYVGSKGAGKWEEKLIHIAKTYRPAWEHRLLPDGEQCLPADESSLLAWTARAVLAQVERVKERHGLCTFDDLIERVAHALDGKRNRAADMLVKRLRDRFHYAIVDEFQDTDPLQWRILRRLFVDGGTGKLFIVGDPKQAIYAFTGADLPTYLLARDQLANEHQAQVTPLEVNWRSCPELITGLNRLFKGSSWFSPGYQAVAPCPQDAARYRVLNDKTDAAALNLVDLRADSERAKDALRRHARWTAAEIDQLLARPNDLRFKWKDTERDLAPGDIAILVFKRSEAEPLVQALRKRRIPYTFYKQSGLWQCDEVYQTLYALEALAKPDDRRLLRRLLLTRFFGLTPHDLADDDLPDHHPTRRLFLQWQELAGQRRWSRLFTSFVQDTAILDWDADDKDRTFANLRHVFRTLEHAAYRDSLDIHGLAAHLRRQQYAPEAEEGGYHPIDTRESKVQILTIHASKGLEFPIVFLAGGFTAGRASSFSEYRDEAKRKVIHLAPDDAVKKLATQERDDEHRRLLYVALTRAMFKLYLPLVGNEAEAGKVPMAGPIFKLLRPALDAAEMMTGDPPITQIMPLEHKAATGKKPSEMPQATSPGSCVELSDPVFPIIDESVFRRRIMLSSFSSLKRKAEREERIIFGDDRYRIDDEEPDTLVDRDVLRGAEFGDLVHRVLEELDWAEIAAAKSFEECWREGSEARKGLDIEIRRTLPTLTARMPRASLEEACRAQVSELVWRALTTKLGPIGIPLCQLPEKDLLREPEFLFPADKAKGAEGFLTGFIDLVFRMEDRYYLLDWKTNVLDAYDPKSLQKAMEEADYTRQYRLYALALARWLRRIRGDAFSFDDHVGGVFYLYLRGLNGKDDSQGVFFTRPNAGELSLSKILT